MQSRAMTLSNRPKGNPIPIIAAGRGGQIKLSTKIMNKAVDKPCITPCRNAGGPAIAERRKNCINPEQPRRRPRMTTGESGRSHPGRVGYARHFLHRRSLPSPASIGDSDGGLDASLLAISGSARRRSSQ